MALYFVFKKKNLLQIVNSFSNWIYESSFVEPSHLLSNENGGILQSKAYPSSRSILNVPLKIIIELFKQAEPVLNKKKNNKHTTCVH